MACDKASVCLGWGAFLREGFFLSWPHLLQCRVQDFLGLTL